MGWSGCLDCGDGELRRLRARRDDRPPPVRQPTPATQRQHTRHPRKHSGTGQPARPATRRWRTPRRPRHHRRRQRRHQPTKPLSGPHAGPPTCRNVELSSRSCWPPRSRPCGGSRPPSDAASLSWIAIRRVPATGLEGRKPVGAFPFQSNMCSIWCRHGLAELSNAMARPRGTALRSRSAGTGQGKPRTTRIGPRIPRTSRPRTGTPRRGRRR